MPPNPRVRFFQPTRSFERSGGQSTFISPLSGTQSLGDGLYMINPLEASYGKENPLAILRRQAIEMENMSRVAERQRAETAKRRYGMVASALEDAAMAGDRYTTNPDMRLLYQVNSGGRPAGAASFQKGDVYGLGTKDLMDLDFTGPEAGTLHSLGVLGTTDGDRALLPGYRFIQKAQDALGNDNLYLETINKPEFSNLEYYFKLGARPTGRRSGNENPFYEFKSRARREPSADSPDQLRLEGFRRGGRVQEMMDVKDAIRQMALQGNLHPEDIARAQKITNRRSASDLVRNDPLSKKLHPLTLLAVRDLEETKAREREAARAAMEVPYGQTLEADLPHPDPAQELVNRYAAALQAPKSNAQREFESGTRSVGDSPLGAVAADPLRYVRDVGMTVGSWLNPTEWVGAPGFRDVLQALREREERSMTPQQQGVAAGRRGMIDAVDLGASVAMAPALLSLLGRGAANLGTRGLRAAHQRFNGPTALPQLEGPALNDALSTYSGYTYDPEKIRRIAGASALGGAAALGYSPDVEAAPPKALLSKSLSNPAWLKAEIAGKHMLSAPQQQERLDALMRRVLDMERTSSGVDPEQAFALRRSVQRLPTQDPAPSSPPEQLNFEEFAGGGSVAGAAKRLAQRAMSAIGSSGEFSAAPPGTMSVVKPKGGKWFSGSVEDALSGLKREGYNDFNPEVDSLNSWIEGPLTKYVKTRMASPNDEIRKLAEQGVLHYGGPREAGWQPYYNEGVKSDKVLGVSDLAKDWERATDTAIKGTSVGNVLEKYPKRRIEPWMEEADPASLVYYMRGGQGDVRQSLQEFTGFNHLIDELSNALNPTSGLPRHLQLTPEAVKNMSMEKAVRRVADINAHRAAQKVEANRKLAEQASLVREYPHSEATPNPKGLRWVELKKGEQLPEGWSFKPGEGEYAGHDWFFDPQGKAHNALNDPRNQMLADQLKYEGDTMGHCVGGYCDDVISGRSRIFSLRDAKGEPHVTVEVGLQPRNIGQQDIPNNYIDEAMEKLGIDSPESQWGREEEIDRLAGDLWRKDNPDVQRIVQIKGKQNRAPNEEYLPFVQDFVRNSPLGQPWAEVGDLQNTGLRRTIDAFNSNELKKIQEAGIEVPTHATSEELEAINRQIWPDPDVRAGTHPDGFAGGGSVAGAAKRLAQRAMSAIGSSGEFSAAPPGTMSVVKPKGGNWLAGSVEDALRGLKPNVLGARTPEELSGMLALPLDEAAAQWSRPDAAIRGWIEGPLTKYVKTRMATPEDEVRKLADEGVTHYNVLNAPGSGLAGARLSHVRKAEGFPSPGLGTTPEGQWWENVSDKMVNIRSANELRDRTNWLDQNDAWLMRSLENNPWLDKIPAESKVYSPFATLPRDTGFDHLIDELSNALDPNSGLPRHLALTPEAVKNMSMEKAVRRVADINAWRAAQKVEANRKLAEQASIVREYAENNPKGLRWVELKAGELPEGYELRNHPTYGENIYGPGDIPITPNGRDDPRYKALADQLKYEGDTMGHCVGGYCDYVISGRSRIFSLRDAKGEPHVTIEVEPFGGGISGEMVDRLRPGTFNEFRNAAHDYASLHEFLQAKHPDLYETLQDTPPRIVQIKGKQNRKPNDEYLPFVQDFVKNPPHGQPWAEVGDLQNTGLRRTIDAFNSNELKKIQEAGIEVPTHATSEELEAINRQIWPDPDVRAGAHPDGFASGGLVEKTSPWSVFSGHNSADWPEEL